MNCQLIVWLCSQSSVDRHRPITRFGFECVCGLAPNRWQHSVRNPIPILFGAAHFTTTAEVSLNREGQRLHGDQYISLDQIAILLFPSCHHDLGTVDRHTRRALFSLLLLPSLASLSTRGVLCSLEQLCLRDGHEPRFSFHRISTKPLITAIQ